MTGLVYTEQLKADYMAPTTVRVVGSSKEIHEQLPEQDKARKMCVCGRKRRVWNGERQHDLVGRHFRWTSLDTAHPPLVSRLGPLHAIWPLSA